MSSFPGSPRLLKGGIALVDPQSFAVLRIIVLQSNSESLSHLLQPQTMSADGNDRSQALRLKGPPVDTFKLDAESMQ